MGDEMPEPALAQRPPPRRGRRGQTGKPCNCGGAFDEAYFRTTAAEWKSRRQVAVEAESIDRQDGLGRRCGVEAGVVRGDIHLAAGKRRRAIAPNGVVKTPRRISIRIGVSEAIEWAPGSRAAVGTGFTHSLDLPDLHCRRAASVRYDAILGLGMGKRYRLAALREQVDYRHAAEG